MSKDQFKELYFDPSQKSDFQDDLKNKGVSQAKLARDHGLQPYEITRFLNGEKALEFNTLEQIFLWLDIQNWNRFCQEEKPEIIFDQKKQYPPHNLLPNPVTVIGRDAELEQIHQFFAPDTQLDQPKVLVLHGLPGVGRTALARYYAEQHFSKYSGGICHIQNSQEQCLESFLSFFCATFPMIQPPDTLGINGKTQYCTQHWPNDDHQPILLIVDDIDDYSFVTPLLAGMPNEFRVLITAPHVLDKKHKHLHLKSPKEEDSLEILKMWVTQELTDPQVSELQDLRAICHRLGHLPLALVLIAESLEYFPPHDILLMLQEDGIQMLSPIAAALDVIWRSLPFDGKQLAFIMGAFAKAPIPNSLFSAVIKRMPTVKRSSPLMLLKSNLIENTSSNPTSRSKRAASSVFCHQLVHDYFEQQLQEAQQAAAIYRAVSMALLDVFALFPDNPSIEESMVINGVTTHAIKALSQFPQAFEGDSYATGHLNLYKSVGQVLASHHDFKAAEDCYSKVIEHYRQTEGEKSLPMATMQAMLATLYREMAVDDQGLEKAEKQAQDAIDCFDEAEIPPDHIDYIDAKFTLVTIQMSRNFTQAGLDETLENLQQAMEKIHGPDSPEVAEILNNRAILYERLERWPESLACHRRAISINEDKLGSSHSNTAASYNNIAKIYQALGDIRQAHNFYQKAIAVFENLAEDFPVAVCLHNLGILQRQTQGLDAARSVLQRSKRSFERAGAEDHPRYHQVLQCLQAIA